MSQDRAFVESECLTFEIFRIFDRYQQRVMIRFLHKERAEPAEIYGRLAAQPCKDLYSKWNIE
jgi:hypothetical protein